LRLATLPKIFDSRGRFIRTPVVASSENEIVGSPISPGRARGTARVLHQPDEKSLAKGDILVARATDPGWTPLFASASAVVLEVGGVLQHGALVAREYGLPCVAGIPNVTSLIQDGSQIEVDGDNGIVRIL
jgi:pyruvate,water dikinase